NFFRRIIPPLGMLDLSPLVAFFALQFIEYFVKGILFR
ncbi:MAG: YggT family protein, partial [Verrucomicrobia bacterium]|nr:YggT family protein [Verrucomicrobiota bacterium]